jgi:uncharacterized repeat protein (TIGR03803 family)
MKAFPKIISLLVAMSALSGLPVATTADAQMTFSTLYTFTNAADGSNPYGNPYGVIVASNTIFGTTTFGGAAGNGTLFSVGLNGAGFKPIYSFTALDATTGTTNADGAGPNAIILVGNTLFGTTTSGGVGGNGTIFSVTTNGTGFRTLHSFTATDANTGTNTDGAQPYAGVILAGGTLYGTTSAGGKFANGNVFSLNTNGAAFLNLHSFTALDAATSTTNADGAQPYAGLIQAGNFLYGGATYGGTAGNGTLFALTTNGLLFTNLHNFSALDTATQTSNTDGAFPNGLVIAGKTLFGTANGGGAFGSGNVFAVNTNGTGFTNFYSFTPTNTGTGINVDGAYPIVGLYLGGSNLYGTAPEGGASGNGTVFSIATNGTGFTTVYSFTALDSATGTTNSDGAVPQGGVFFAGNSLFGTAYYGGGAGDGTIFRLRPSVSLSIQRSPTNIVLTWGDATYQLQSSPTVTGPFTTVAAAGSPYTNAITSSNQFFRLIGN